MRVTQAHRLWGKNDLAKTGVTTSRSGRNLPGVAGAGDGLAESMAALPSVLLISVLSLGRADYVLRQLVELPGWLGKFSQRTGILCHIVVRNNDPRMSFAEVASRVAEIDGSIPLLRCTLITDVPNNGFGEGHNGNVALVPSDYVLILNDDIDFPHIGWLDDAWRMLLHDDNLACVAGEENPKHLNPGFGNGLLPEAPHLHALSYGEASILLCRRAALDRVGGFHADYAWAMCEDADLSLRFQQAGLRIAYLSMPHRHWRSSSFNTLPPPIKSSILEHNRAALFANWHDSLATGDIGRFEVFDVWSDGIGDVMCALPHLLARIGPLSAEQRRDIVVNTSHPELIEWLGLAGIRLMSVADLAQLRAQLRADGITTLRSTRQMNFSLPFNIHALMAGTLGIAPAGDSARADLAGLLRRLRLPPGLVPRPGAYCVVHLEFARDHEGRGLSPAATSRLLALCGALFDHIVLVGRECRLSADMCGADAASITDLQGALSLPQLAALVAHAGFFVGIDSFPAHLAQAAGVPAALVFGAVHPLTRSWNTSRLWPLTAALDCIGCYHTQLEPSVPFCMRRDQACMSALPSEAMEPVLRAMIEGRPHDWSAAELRLQGLQARLLRVARFHPAPPERLFRPAAAPNEQMSNMIYRMTEHMAELLRDQYQTSAMRQLHGRIHELESELFRHRVEADSAPHGLRATSALLPQSDAAGPRGTRILQLARLALTPTRCTIRISDQWIDIAADADDPQVLLPSINANGRVQLRLSFVIAAGDALQVYWASGEDSFSSENVRTVMGESVAVAASFMFDAVSGVPLRIRIDPTTGVGVSRLHGSLGGAFVLSDPSAAEPASPGQETIIVAATSSPDAETEPMRLQPRPPSRGAARRRSNV